MPDNTTTTPTSRKIEIGVLVTVALAVIGFAFWLGGLDAQVKKLDPARIDAALAKTGSVPRGTIVAWYSKAGPVPAGWGLCDGNDGRPNLTGKFLRGTVQFGDVGKDGGSEFHVHVVTGHGNKQGEGVAYSDNRELGNADKREHLPPFITVVYIIKL